MRALRNARGSDAGAGGLRCGDGGDDDRSVECEPSGNDGDGDLLRRELQKRKGLRPL